jgi:hypothetical protein
MPGRRTEYFKDYMKARKQARRAKLIEMLGGCCVRCGTTEDLEFDHIDPATKRFNVCSDLTRAWDELVAETLKTQLLCRPCHVAKGAEDRPETPHGRHRYVYWQCRCEICRAANAAASARQRARRLKLDEPSRAHEPSSGTLDLDRSGVAQSAEQPAVNRLVGSSSLPPRAKAGSKTGAGARRSRAPSFSPAATTGKRRADKEAAG